MGSTPISDNAEDLSKYDPGHGRSFIFCPFDATINMKRSIKLMYT